MPRHEEVPLPQGFWTQLTANDVTEILLQNVGRWPVAVTASVGEVSPAADAAGVIYPLKAGDRVESLDKLAPGISGANRVWAISRKGHGRVMVSHA